MHHQVVERLVQQALGAVGHVLDDDGVVEIGVAKCLRVLYVKQPAASWHGHRTERKYRSAHRATGPLQGNYVRHE